MLLHINFLPHRAWAREEHRRFFRRDLRWAALGVVVLCAVGYAAIYSYWRSNQTAVENYRSHLLQLQQMAAVQARTQKELAQLQAQQLLVDDLAGEQLALTRLWSDLALGLMDGAYLRDVQLGSQGVTIAGNARGERDILALRAHLDAQTQRWVGFTVAEVASAAAEGAGDTRFVIRAQLAPASTPSEKKP